MSCLTLAPSALCASGIDLAQVPHRVGLLECWSRSRCRRPGRARAPPPSSASSAALACASLSASECSISTVQGAGASGWRSCGEVAFARARARSAFITSKPVSPGPSRSWASASSAIAAASVGSDGQRGQPSRPAAGSSFSVAAVMIAERAFAADEQVAQVVAGVVLAQAAAGRPRRRPSAVTTSRPRHLLARIAVAQHLRAAGVGREVAADRAAAFGGEAEREQQAARGGRRPAPAAARSRPRRRASGWRRRRRASRFMRAVEQQDLRPLASGTEPPTRPVLPPCGDDRSRRARAQARDDRRDLGRDPGPHDGERAAAGSACASRSRTAARSASARRRSRRRPRAQRVEQAHGATAVAGCAAAARGIDAQAGADVHRAGDEEHEGEHDLGAAQQRAGARLARRSHRALGDVEPDEQAESSDTCRGASAAGRRAAAAAATP